jgi:hypothetical protein
VLVILISQTTFLLYILRPFLPTVHIDGGGARLVLSGLNIYSSNQPANDADAPMAREISFHFISFHFISFDLI